MNLTKLIVYLYNFVYKTALLYFNLFLCNVWANLAEFLRDTHITEPKWQWFGGQCKENL